MTSTIDHLVVASPDLSADSSRCREAGIEVISGGTHPNSGTENALIPLADGTYIELLAVTDTELADGWPPALAALNVMESDNRLATFAVRVDDIFQSQRYAEEQGLKLSSPKEGSRERPDGELLRWHVAYPEAPGLPFVIQDETDRNQRVPKPQSNANLALSLECVVLTGDATTGPSDGLAALGVDESTRPSVILQDPVELDADPGLRAVFLRGETPESASLVQALAEAIRADIRPTLA